jgi:hypothetical protein
MTDCENKLAETKTRRGRKGDRAGRHGFDALLEAADGQLKERCEEIAKALADNSEKGNIQSVKLLCDLAEGKKRLKSEKVKKRRSLAAEWSQEPEWIRNVSEEGAETGFGGLEPE